MRVSRSMLALCLATAAFWLGCGAMGGGMGGTPAVSVPALAKVPVGRPPILLAMAPDGAHLYATSNDGRLVVIDTASNAVVASFNVPPYSNGIALTADGSRAFVTNLFGNTLTVLQTSPPALGPAVDLINQFRPGGYGRIAVAPDGSDAYVVNQANLALVAVELSSGGVTNSTLDIAPTDIAITPSGSAALVCGCRQFCVPGTCKVLNPAEGTYNAYIEVGASPYRVVIDGRGQTAYVTSLGDAGVSVVDIASKVATATIRVPTQPTGIAISPDGSRVYVSSQTLGTIAVIDTATRSVIATAQVADQAREVVLSPDGGRAYVSTTSGVVVLDTQTLAPQ